MTEHLIVLFGLSGSGKTTLAQKLAGALGYTYIDIDRYFNRRKTPFKLSNGKIVPNYDCEEAINWASFTRDLRDLPHVVLASYIADNNLLWPLTKRLHIIEVRMAETAEQCIERCIATRAVTKRFSPFARQQDSLVVRELVYPFYQRQRAGLTLTHVVMTYHEGVRRDVTDCLRECQSFFV